MKRKWELLKNSLRGNKPLNAMKYHQEYNKNMKHGYFFVMKCVVSNTYRVR